METTEKILLIIGVIGAVLLAVNVFQIVTKRKTKKSNYGIRAAGNMLILPYATFCVINKDTWWTVIFVLMLVSSLIAIFNLASDTKEK